LKYRAKKIHDSIKGEGEVGPGTTLFEKKKGGRTDTQHVRREREKKKPKSFPCLKRKKHTGVEPSGRKKRCRSPAFVNEKGKKEKPFRKKKRRRKDSRRPPLLKKKASFLLAALKEARGPLAGVREGGGKIAKKTRIGLEGGLGGGKSSARRKKKGAVPFSGWGKKKKACSRDWKRGVKCISWSA